MRDMPTLASTADRATIKMEKLVNSIFLVVRAVYILYTISLRSNSSRLRSRERKNFL